MIKKEHDGYVTLMPDEGFLLTDWKEGDDILNYSSATYIYAANSKDLSAYYEINKAQDIEYVERQQKRLEELYGRHE